MMHTFSNVIPTTVGIQARYGELSFLYCCKTLQIITDRTLVETHLDPDLRRDDVLLEGSKS